MSQNELNSTSRIGSAMIIKDSKNYPIALHHSTVKLTAPGEVLSIPAWTRVYTTGCLGHHQHHHSREPELDQNFHQHHCFRQYCNHQFHQELQLPPWPTWCQVLLLICVKASLSVSLHLQYTSIKLYPWPEIPHKVILWGSFFLQLYFQISMRKKKKKKKKLSGFVIQGNKALQTKKMFAEEYKYVIISSSQKQDNFSMCFMSSLIYMEQKNISWFYLDHS